MNILPSQARFLKVWSNSSCHCSIKSFRRISLCHFLMTCIHGINIFSIKNRLISIVVGTPEGSKLYTGGCHCGAVTIALNDKPLPESKLEEDNCSICARV
jgi:hypothetical protein